jgi:hypothetical protein
MNVVEAALRQIAADLDGLDAMWALVGGLAVSVRSEPRFTRDVDVAVAVFDDQAAEHTVHVLTSAGYRLAATVEHLLVTKLLARDDDTRPAGRGGPPGTSGGRRL